MSTKHIITLAFLLSMVTVAVHGSALGVAKDLDPVTGKIPIKGAKVAVSVTKSEKVPLPTFKPLLLTLGGDFIRDQADKIGYFSMVVDRQGMEKLLIREGKSDLVTDVTNYLSWKKIADNYKPFLVLKLDTRKEGKDEYVQLKAIRADSADDVFIAEVKLRFTWGGPNDDKIFYPLFNAFIDWMNKNK
jgi:hypothetical protein